MYMIALILNIITIILIQTTSIDKTQVTLIRVHRYQETSRLTKTGQQSLLQVTPTFKGSRKMFELSGAQRKQTGVRELLVVYHLRQQKPIPSHSKWYLTACRIYCAAYHTLYDGIVQLNSYKKASVYTAKDKQDIPWYTTRTCCITCMFYIYMFSSNTIILLFNFSDCSQQSLK